ncbi:hypothetical protein Ahy_B03g063387 [Arachis hypogaea]|uniref:Aminotransferase-like plant mobile domain-containing protein n=1 Tax=Arachis hypogaea TaxID=3818 RepID=A0A444ZXJ2_ARAHY|nr:hypothetical protein Ahy_B03g063387 [Arachis hypogaea]
MQPNRTYKIAQKNPYSEFFSHHMGNENDHVTDEESVAFLYYWLNVIVFYSRSVQIQKLFLPLVALLHEGHKFNLAKLILEASDGGSAPEKQHIEGFRLAPFNQTWKIPTQLKTYSGLSSPSSIPAKSSTTMT